MSHFIYQLIKTKKEKIGVWIRPHSNPELYQKIKKIGRVKMNERVERIVIIDVRSVIRNGNQVSEALLEVWLSKMTFRKVFRTLFGLSYEAERHIVFTFWEKEDFWVCEGDLGTGLKDF